MAGKTQLSISTRVGHWLSKWRMAILCHWIFFQFTGQRKLTGQMFVETMRIFGANRSQASFVFLFEVLVHYLSDPLVGFMGSRFGLRLVIVLGCVLASASIAACSLANDVTFLTLCWGLPLGFFSSMAVNLLPTLLHFQYRKDKAMAIGIAFAGPCVGGFFFSPLYKYLLDTYGMSGSFLILGAITLHSVPAAMLLENPKVGTEALKHKYNNKVELDTYEESHIHISSTNGGIEGRIVDARTNLPDGLATVDMVAKSTTTLKVQKMDRELSTANSISSSDVNMGKTGSNFEEIDASDTVNELDINEIKCGDIIIPTNAHIDSSPSVEEIGICAETVNVAKPQTCREPFKDGNTLSKLEEKGASMDISETSDLIFDKEVSNKENIARKDSLFELTYKSPNPIKVKKIWHVLYDPLFLMVSFIASAQMSILLVVNTVVVDFSLDKGLSLDQGVYTVMCFTISDMVGRFGLGWVTDKGHVSCEVFAAACFAGIAVCCLVFAHTSFTGGMLSLAVAGVLMGALMTVFSVLLSKYFSQKENAMANASRYLLVVPASLAISPMISFFRETLGSYVLLFYCLLALSLLCSIIALLMLAIARRKEKKRKNGD